MDHNEGKIPPKKQLKSKKITVSFTADEGYKNPTNWMRSLVMNMLHREAVLSDKEVKSIDKLSDQLWKIGHNINQIARGINIDFRIWFLKIKAGRSHTRAFKSSPEGRKRNARPDRARTGNDPEKRRSKPMKKQYKRHWRQETEIYRACRRSRTENES